MQEILKDFINDYQNNSESLEEIKSEYKNYCGSYVEAERINDTETMDRCKNKIADLIYQAMFVYDFDLETIDISDCI